MAAEPPLAHEFLVRLQGETARHQLGEVPSESAKVGVGGAQPSGSVKRQRVHLGPEFGLQRGFWRGQLADLAVRFDHHPVFIGVGHTPRGRAHGPCVPLRIILDRRHADQLLHRLLRGRGVGDELAADRLSVLQDLAAAGCHRATVRLDQLDRDRGHGRAEAKRDAAGALRQDRALPPHHRDDEDGPPHAHVGGPRKQVLKRGVPDLRAYFDAFRVHLVGGAHLVLHVVRGGDFRRLRYGASLARRGPLLGRGPGVPVLGLPALGRGSNLLGRHRHRATK
mmetsp:Transcript_93950/g.287474  ORF Transcript_93950/g.287474 Transcript_93950/m.287474 type:complete len:280 (+) Transcript_93950:300-1139(+)